MSRDQSPGSTQTSALVQVRGLRKDYTVGSFPRRSTVRAVNDVSFDIARGEIVALVGESGSGKSTIARILARLEDPTAGQLIVDGQDVFATERRRASLAYRQRVQMVFQDPFGSLNPAHRIEHVLTRSLLIHSGAGSKRTLQLKLRELMTTVGLGEQLLDRYPHQLSGGQRQRVAIARALAAEPEIILADEPTSMLDVSVRIGVLNLMRRLRDEKGVAMLYITHDLASARYIADTTMVMRSGALVEGGESLELMDSPAHPYTRLLLAAVPDARRETAAGTAPRTRLDRTMRSASPANARRVALSNRHWVLQAPGEEH